ncbi:hypothetical protein [Streptomyces fructofermentans]|uniref:hypothetical protein n=1 Tax=Streptomyces fructofermentans TaxID=152141 RepID=UPI0033FC47E1
MALHKGFDGTAIHSHFNFQSVQACATAAAETQEATITAPGTWAPNLRATAPRSPAVGQVHRDATTPREPSTRGLNLMSPGAPRREEPPAKPTTRADFVMVRSGRGNRLAVELPSRLTSFHHGCGRRDRQESELLGQAHRVSGVPEPDPLAAAAPVRQHTEARSPSFRPLHMLLCLSSVTIVLISINRKSPVTLAFVADNHFLRWVEVNNMILGLCTVLLYHLISVQLISGSDKQLGSGRAGLHVMFIVGAYFYALSLGNHEISNYLHGSFCLSSPSQFCDIISFNDNIFSDFLFIIGFTLLNITVILTQSIFPSLRRMSLWDNVAVSLNAMFVATGIVANLAFEKSGFDSCVVAAMATFTLIMLRRAPEQLMLRYYSISYALGALVTAAIKLS